MNRSGRDGRFVLCAVGGQLLGAMLGGIGARWHANTPTDPVGSGIASTRPEIPHDDLSDPFVAWPLCGAVAGFVAGAASVSVFEALRRRGRSG